MTALDLAPPTAPLARGRGDGIGRLARRTQRGQGGRRVLVALLVAAAVALGIAAGAFAATTSRTEQENDLLDRFGPTSLILTEPSYLPFDLAPDLTPAQQAWLDAHPGTPEPDGFDDDGGGFPELVVTLDEVLAGLPAGSEQLVYRHNGLNGYPSDQLLVSDLDVTHPLAGRTFDTGGRVDPLRGRQGLASASYLASMGAEVGDVLQVAGIGEVEVVGTLTRAVARSQHVLVVAPGRDISPYAWETTARVAVSADRDLDLVAGALRTLIGEQLASEGDQERALEAPMVTTRSEVVASREDPATLATLIGMVVSAFAGTVAAMVAACAFAVGVRRRLRQIGMLGAVGATPAQVARLLRREGLVIGLGGAALGAVVGLAAAWSSGPLLERLLDRDVTMLVPPVAVLPSVLVGGLAAMGAAWWPARTAARVPVVAALAGRVPAGRVPRWLPIASGICAVGGVLLFGRVIAYDASGDGTMVALQVLLAALLGTLGFAGLGIPLLALGGRVADRLPVRARLAVRDSARQRTRSGAAVAALVPVLALPLAALTVFTADVPGEGDSPGFTWRDPDPAPYVTVHGPWVDGRAVPPSVDDVTTVAGLVPSDGRSADVVQLGRPDASGAALVMWSPPGAADGLVLEELPSELLALATPDLLELLELPTDAVGAGEVLVLRDGQYVAGPDEGDVVPVVVQGMPDGTMGPVFTRIGDLTARVVDEVPPVPGVNALLTEATAAELGLVEVGRPAALGLERPPSPEETGPLAAAMQGGVGYVDVRPTVPFGMSPLFRLLQLAAGVVAVLAVIAVVAGMTAALAATESDADLRKAVALGAPPSLRRRFHGIQAWWHTTVAAVLGSMLGVAVGWAVIDATELALDPRIALAAVGWVLVVPVLIGLVIAAFLRSSPVEAPRRRMA